MIDVMLDADFDLLIENGDFVLGHDEAQRAALIIATYPGNWKQWPLTGVGQARLLNGPIDGQLRRDITMQLQADGLQASGQYFADAINLVVQ